MIIQVAGTNGSGKSTVVRAVMAAGRVKRLEEGGVPSGHELRLSGGHHSIFIVGYYAEAATGGCDTIHSVEEIYARVARASMAGPVLFEGIRALNQTRGPELVRRVTVPFVVVLLTTPLGVSLQSIDARRAARGDGSFTADPRDIENNHIRARNYAARMRDAGARVVRASREEAPARILELLRSA